MFTSILGYGYNLLDYTVKYLTTNNDGAFTRREEINKIITTLNKSAQSILHSLGEINDSEVGEGQSSILCVKLQTLNITTYEEFVLKNTHLHIEKIDNLLNRFLNVWVDEIAKIDYRSQEEKNAEALKYHAWICVCTRNVQPQLSFSKFSMEKSERFTKMDPNKLDLSPEEFSANMNKYLEYLQRPVLPILDSKKEFIEGKNQVILGEKEDCDAFFEVGQWRLLP